eukprot:6190464-Pleurochrysis_carterae.AAC.2
MIAALIAIAWRRLALFLAKLLATKGRPWGLSSSMFRRISRASKSLSIVRIVASVSGRLLVASFMTSFTFTIVFMDSLKRRTTAQSFSAVSASPS